MTVKVESQREGVKGKGATLGAKAGLLKLGQRLQSRDIWLRTLELKWQLDLLSTKPPIYLDLHSNIFTTPKQKVPNTVPSQKVPTLPRQNIAV
jgi:hypothetical protein